MIFRLMLLHQYHQWKSRPQYITTLPVTVFASFLDLKSLQFLAYLHDADFLPSREPLRGLLPISRKESLN